LDVESCSAFDHDAGELLGARIAENDAAVFAEGGIASVRRGRFGKGFERRLGFYFYVDDGLRVVLEPGDERFEAAVSATREAILTAVRRPSPAENLREK